MNFCTNSYDFVVNLKKKKSFLMRLGCIFYTNVINTVYTCTAISIYFFCFLDKANLFIFSS